VAEFEGILTTALRNITVIEKVEFDYNLVPLLTHRVQTDHRTVS